jgi:glycosyltransferase involved in cell wall biosynthesis
MMKTLHLIPSLDYTGAAKQFVTLLAGVNRVRGDHRVCVLEGDGPLSEPLRARGVGVYALNWTRRFDPVPLWKLRRLLHSWQPGLVHVWRPAALRALAMSSPRLSCPVVVSNPLDGERPNRLDRWLLGRVSRLVVRSEAEAARCRRAGLRVPVVIIPPGVATGTSASVVPPLSRTVFCAGPFFYPKKYRTTLLAVDILHHLFEDLQLLLLGDGPDRARLQEAVLHLATRPPIHFLGTQPDAAPLIARAHVVWVRGGMSAALEAMALGRPVIAADVPAVRDVVIDGVTGFLVPPGEQVPLARRTRLLLEEPECAAQVAKAGQRHVRERFSADRMTAQFDRLYSDLAA